MRRRMLLYGAALFGMVVYAITYMTWLLVNFGWSDWHVFWLVLGAFGHYTVMHVYAVRKHDREVAFDGSKTEPYAIDYIELQRDIERARFGNDRS